MLNCCTSNLNPQAALSLNDRVTVADLPWPDQAEAVFG